MGFADLLPPMLAQGYPPEPTWSTDSIPDLSGKVVIVTGGYAGVGKETVKTLLVKNAKVYIAGRSQTKAAPVIQELLSETGKEPLFINLDLASLKSVKEAAASFLSKEQRLDILFNNGGVMMSPIDMLTSDGYDLQFGTNVLGHFYFTKLLIPVLIATAKISPDGHSRVINTASSAAYMGKFDFETFKDSPARRKLAPQALYGQSKLGNVVVSNEFARRYGKEGVISCALNPGNIDTELGRHVAGFMKVVESLVLKKYPPPYGALTQLWAGTTPEGLEFNGKFLIPWARRAEPGAASLPEASEPQIGGELWAWLEKQVAAV